MSASGGNNTAAVDPAGPDGTMTICSHSTGSSGDFHANPLILENTTLAASDTTGTLTFGIFVSSNSGRNIFMRGGSITTSNNGHTDQNIYHAGTGTITLEGVTYDYTKVRVTGTGVVIDVTNKRRWTSAGMEVGTYGDGVAAGTAAGGGGVSQTTYGGDLGID